MDRADPEPTAGRPPAPPDGGPEAGARGPGLGSPPRAAWSGRWRHLARTVSLEPTAPVLVGLSGGADSTYLLHVLAAARERPPLVAVHVDHGLRGAESARDAAFCTRLCARLGVRLKVRRVSLEAEGPSLEARARAARYRALALEARRFKIGTLVTGHHADDMLETLLMRWMRGTALTGLAALRPRLELELAGVALTVVRPLIGLRREEVRERLATAGLAWCEDGSNGDERFARNAVRNALLPGIERAAGSAGIENLRAFGRAVEELETHLARGTAELAWRPPRAALAHRAPDRMSLGGTLERGRLMRLPGALRRRALWRLVLEGTGRAPRRALLEALLADLARGRCTRHALPAGHTLQLRARTIELLPPERARLDSLQPAATPSGSGSEPELPFPEPADAEPDRAPAAFLGVAEERAVPLEVARTPTESGRPGPGESVAEPSSVTLGDGRRLSARRVRRDPRAPVPRGPSVVELDAGLAVEALTVRWPRPGDRFHPLGAPGSRPLRRVLADHGIPREERARVPLVLAGERIVWVAGVRPAEPARVILPAAERLRLELSGGPLGGGTEPPAPPAQKLVARGQRSFWETPADHREGSPPEARRL